MLRPLVAALALLAVAAPAAAAHQPDAEIFATDNTATITDPDDPRLDDRLKGFARRVERLFGGSVTLDRHLLLVASLADAQFARAFAKRIGGDLKRATTTYGERRFVDVATDGRARIEKRTLRITGTPGDDRVSLHGNEIDFGDDGVIDFEPSRHRYDRVVVDLGDGVDTLIHEGTSGDDRIAVRGLTGVEYVEVNAGDGDDSVTIDAVDDLWEVHTDLGAADGDDDRATVNDSDEGNQSFIGNFGRLSVLAGVFATFEGAEPTDRLRLNGNGGEDILSASTDAMKITLDGGDDADVVLGGPGPDLLIGGDDFDDIKGGRGDDTVSMGADFDRFSWAPGDGSDTVDGGPGSRDSLFFAGSADAESFELRGDRFTRDVAAESPPGRFRIVMDLDGIEVVDAVAGAGADTFRVADSSVGELNASLAPGGGAADPDRIEIEGTEGDDDVSVTGKKVVFGSATVTGLPVKLGISFAQIGFDTLAIDTLGGDDSVDTSGLGPDVIGLETD